MNSERLKDFRQEAYELLVRGKDATFELMDAVMTTPECSLFGGIFAQSIIPSSMAKRLRGIARL
ncbi:MULTISPECIES: hypothetical protein [unclassified Microcoleus]|uniref:hypothetical protein n=1 Tax=unclassified Microcoleus TaxID=2642155 RepID=UPI002600BD43|nr:MULTISPECIES: hypothetical protein [unclassified Microcoleus]TAE52285.1 MAG: hypothetical protein EAZ88_15615 [Oscillatoriales cyanobacterium]